MLSIVPSAPQNVRIDDVQSTTFVVAWDKPEKENGKITESKVSKISTPAMKLIFYVAIFLKDFLTRFPDGSRRLEFKECFFVLSYLFYYLFVHQAQFLIEPFISDQDSDRVLDTGNLFLLY